MSAGTIEWTREKIAAARLVLDRAAIRENLDRRGYRSRDFILVRIFPEENEKFTRSDAGTVLEILNDHARKDSEFLPPDLGLVSGGRICLAWLSTDGTGAGFVEDMEKSLRQTVERVIRSSYARAVN